MTSTSPRRLALTFAALLPSGALAHPLHDASGFAAGTAHPFLGADHLLAMVAVGLWAWGLGGRARWAVPATFVTAMVAGAGVVLAGLAVPSVEPMVAASVLAFGLLLATGVKQPLAASGLVAVFAAFHGAAHALEIPGGPVAGFAAGFVLATALLHAGGLGVGCLLAPSPRLARLAGAPIALAGGLLLVRAVA